ncbi:hypothetical protein [Catenulispora pinisilvae]|uniref:hypothetical protein n=1 Tax=Catenulispora pinisilvae TaxID=2705253 RepID=UPI0018910E0D|nr:hypothetical protein [Catenulispora pinisilvae]
MAAMQCSIETARRSDIADVADVADVAGSSAELRDHVPAPSPRNHLVDHAGEELSS